MGLRSDDDTGWQSTPQQAYDQMKRVQALEAEVERLEMRIEAMKACCRNILRYEGETSNSFVATSARAALGADCWPPESRDTTSDSHGSKP